MNAQLPLRVRLALWYGIAIAVALFSIGFVSLWMVHRAIDDLENDELQERVRSVSRFVESRPAGETTAQLRQETTATFEFIHGNKWLQVIDEHGQWLDRSKHVSSLYPTLVLPQHAPEGGSYFTYKADSICVRALIAPIAAHGVRYTVQTGLTLNQTLAILSDLRIHLFLLIAFGLVVSSLGGYFMSRKALTPIAAIAAEAQRINDKNLNSRLPSLATRDELAALSNTLNQMLGRIEAGYQSVRSFTSNAAHELRSPVALLRAETEVALAFPRDAAYYRETCERILKHSIQMTHLIDQLLALARADAGVEIFQFAPVNLPDLMHEAADEWTDRFAEDSIHFQRDVPTTDFWLSADSFALKRLLTLLLENAWRYTPSGQSVALRLTTAGNAAGQLAVISVEDTGIGISPKDRARIFRRFQRIARPLHGEFSGSGIGLVLAQAIAEKHHSAIRLESTVGEGSRFSLQLPTCPPAPGPETDELNPALVEHLSESL